MKNLKDILDNDTLISNITGLINNSKLPHAILIDGGSASQRSEFAKYLASVFVCSGTSRPCGLCSNCKKSEDDCHPDIIVTNPEDLNEKTFKVSAVRNIRNDAYIIPNEADKKVYILKSADKMNPQAQNALLKIIEEPPEYARFILECSSRASLIETIMSRVTPFNLGADSSSINTLDSQKSDAIAVELAKALMNSTEVEFMKEASAFEKDKNLFSSVLPYFQLIFRDALAIKSDCPVILANHTDISRSLASKFSVKVLMSVIENIEDFNLSLTRNANKNLLITRFCSVMRNTAYNNI